MKRLHFSLAGLLGAVAFAAVGCTALRYASEWWASGTFTLAVGVLLAATLAVVLRKGRERAFPAGFALFGWVYLLLVFGPWIGAATGPRLFSTKLFSWLEPKLRTTTEQVPWANTAGYTSYMPGYTIVGSAPSNAVVWEPAQGQTWPVVPPWNNFQTAGHSLLALLAALTGGILGARFFAPPAERQKPAETAGGSAARA